LVSLRSAHGKEFENSSFIDYCNEHDVDHNFSTPRTPRQNEVVECKNRTQKTWLELCVLLVLFLENFGQRRWIHHVTLLIGVWSDLYSTRLPMNFSKDD